MKCTFPIPIANVDKILTSLNSLWTTSDERDNTQPGTENISVEYILQTVDSYDAEDFNTICSSVQVLRYSSGIDSFSEQFPWPLKIRSINIFCSEADSLKLFKRNIGEDEDPYIMLANVCYYLK